MYIGLGVYRMAESPNGIWSGSKELLEQINDIRKETAHPGYSFYSVSSFDKIGPAIRDSLKNRYNKYPAFPPTMPWLDSIAPIAPSLKAIPSSQGTLLQWKNTNTNKEQLTYAVYRFSNHEPIDINNSAKIISVQKGMEYLDKDANKIKQPVYVVTALDRLWNESKVSNVAGE